MGLKTTPNRGTKERGTPVLTDAQCRNATCPADKKRVRLTDSGGLYLEISPGGSKRWFQKIYRDGKETRLALGSYPTVGLIAARRARDAAKLQKAEGTDPIQARKVEKLKEDLKLVKEKIKAIDAENK